MEKITATQLGHSQKFGNVTNNDTFFTLKVNEPNGIIIQREGKSNIRRLTPIECERLQGFPDGWTEGISESQRYKCLGNAVSVPVVKEIMKRLYSKSSHSQYGT